MGSTAVCRTADGRTVHLAWGRQLYAGQLTEEQFIGKLTEEQFIGQLTEEQFIWPGVDSCMQELTVE